MSTQRVPGPLQGKKFWPVLHRQRPRAGRAGAAAPVGVAGLADQPARRCFTGRRRQAEEAAEDRSGEGLQQGATGFGGGENTGELVEALTIQGGDSKRSIRPRTERP